MKIDAELMIALVAPDEVCAHVIRGKSAERLTGLKKTSVYTVTLYPGDELEFSFIKGVTDSLMVIQSPCRTRIGISVYTPITLYANLGFASIELTLLSSPGAVIAKTGEFPFFDSATYPLGAVVGVQTTHDLFKITSKIANYGIFFTLNTAGVHTIACPLRKLYQLNDKPQEDTEEMIIKEEDNDSHGKQKKKVGFRKSAKKQ